MRRQDDVIDHRPVIDSWHDIDDRDRQSEATFALVPSPADGISPAIGR